MQETQTLPQWGHIRHYFQLTDLSATAFNRSSLGMLLHSACLGKVFYAKLSGLGYIQFCVELKVRLESAAKAS